MAINGLYPPWPPLSASYCTAARKMSSFYDKALAQAGLGIAQYSTLAVVERRVDEPPTTKEAGGGPLQRSIDAWAEPSSAGTHGIITMTPSDDEARSKQISLSARGYSDRDVMITLAMNQQLRRDAERRAQKQRNI